MISKEKFLEKVAIVPGGCWEWLLGKGSAGYGTIAFEGKHYYAHRVAFGLFKGPIPEGMCVCHTCDNRGCCNPEHLWPGTKGDNHIDMLKKGRGNAPRGSAHWNSKLSDAQIDEIFKTREANKGRFWGGKQLAKKFGVSPVIITEISKNVRRKKAEVPNGI